MPTYRGAWRLRVIGTDAMYPQRVVIDGSAHHVIPGEVGQEMVISGKKWRLRPEYHDGNRWRRSVRVSRRQRKGDVSGSAQIIVCKDTYRFDATPNDLTLSLQEIPAEPFAITDGVTSGAAGGGSFTRRLGVDLLEVTITNTGFEAFEYDAVLDIAAAGRAQLAEHGVHVHNDWSPAILRATGQEVFHGAVAVPPLEVGDAATVYFPVDMIQSEPGRLPVEFMLRRESDGRPLVDRCTAAITLPGASAGLPDAAPTEAALPPLTSQSQVSEQIRAASYGQADGEATAQGH